MRAVFCNLCLPSACSSKPSPGIYSPPVLRSGDEKAPSVDGDAVEKKPSSGDGVLEVKERETYAEKVSAGGLVDGQCGVGDVSGQIILKSSLKKPRKPGMEEVRRGRVKWMDILGKELVDVQEFEPSESEDSEGDCGDKSCCACVIQ